MGWNELVVPDRPLTRATEILDATIENTYPDRWLVDVKASSNRWFANVQVLSPYLHPEGGAGLSITPLKGTRGLLIIPSDGSPPLFLPGLANMRPATAEPGVSQGGKAGTQTSEQEGLMSKQPPNAPRFDNNRPPQADGDQCWRGHDGQGVSLLMGGIVRSYAGPLCQTLLDVNGKRTEVCRSSVEWWEGGMRRQRRKNVEGKPTYEQTDVYRVQAADEHGSIRTRYGRSLLGEPDGFNAVEAAAAAGLPLDEGVMELTLSPNGFSTGDGEVASDKTRNKTLFRALLTLGGGLLIRALQAVVLKLASKLRIEVDGDVILTTKGQLILEGKKGLILRTDGTMKTQAALVQAGGGNKGVVRQGDQVMISVPPGTLLNGLPITPPPAFPFFPGTITSPGSPDFKVG